LNKFSGYAGLLGFDVIAFQTDRPTNDFASTFKCLGANLATLNMEATCPSETPSYAVSKPSKKISKQPFKFRFNCVFNEDLVQKRHGDQPVSYHAGRDNKAFEVSSPPPKFF